MSFHKIPLIINDGFAPYIQRNTTAFRHCHYHHHVNDDSSVIYSAGTLLNFSADFKQTSDKPIFCGGGWNQFPYHPKPKTDDDDYTHDWTSSCLINQSEDALFTIQSNFHPRDSWLQLLLLTCQIDSQFLDALQAF